MILTKEICIKLNNKNRDHFKDLGYDISHKIINVNIMDMMEGSVYKIDVMCDICKKHRTIMYRNYINNVKNYGFYTCEKCSHMKNKMTEKKIYGDENYRNVEKNKITCLDKYGVEHPLQKYEFKEKSRLKKIEKYGDEKYNNRDKFKETNLKKYSDENYNNFEKYKKTCLDRYGVENYFSSNEFKISQNILLDNEIKNKWVLYKRKSNRILKNVKREVFKKWNGLDYYDNECIRENLSLPFYDGDYPTIDHKISVHYGFMNNIPVEDINKIENLVITKRRNNASKGK